MRKRTVGADEQRGRIALDAKCRQREWAGVDPITGDIDDINIGRIDRQGQVDGALFARVRCRRGEPRPRTARISRQIERAYLLVGVGSDVDEGDGNRATGPAASLGTSWWP